MNDQAVDEHAMHAKTRSAFASQVAVLCTANVDSFGADLPPRISGEKEEEARGSLEGDGVPRDPSLAKDYVQGESLLRRDLALKLTRQIMSASDGDDGDSTGGDAGVRVTAAGLAHFEAMSYVLGTPPIANEVTIHQSIMSPATGSYESHRSAGPALLAACGYEESWAACSVCCACPKRTVVHLAQQAAARKRTQASQSAARRRGGGAASGSPPAQMGLSHDHSHGGGGEAAAGPAWAEPGSLVRRRGGGYYCHACLPLDIDDLAVRAARP